MKCSLPVLMGAALLASAVGLRAEPLPTRVLSCSAARIKAIGSRLMDSATGQPDKGSGSRVTFDNGGVQVSYDEEPAIRDQSRVGDHVLICLVYVPRHCPPGDDRGHVYTTTNLRSLVSWTLSDSEHQCGGA